MYYKIEGNLGKIIQFLEIPARKLFNQLEGRANFIQDLALFVILGIPAVIGISLTKPIYWVAGEKIKQIDYDQEKNKWEAKFDFVIPSQQNKLIDCLIRLKIKADCCIHNYISQLDHCDPSFALFYSYHKEQRLAKWRNEAASGKIKILAVNTFRCAASKKYFFECIAKSEKKVTYPSAQVLKEKFYDCKNDDIGCQAITEQAVLNTKFLLYVEGAIKYPTQKYKNYLENAMTQSTTLEENKV